MRLGWQSSLTECTHNPGSRQVESGAFAGHSKLFGMHRYVRTSSTSSTTSSTTNLAECVRMRLTITRVCGRFVCVADPMHVGSFLRTREFLPIGRQNSTSAQLYKTRNHTPFRLSVRDSIQWIARELSECSPFICNRFWLESWTIECIPLINSLLI